MRSAFLLLFVFACCALLAVQGRGQDANLS
jgi:hypothetical protein